MIPTDESAAQMTHLSVQFEGRTLLSTIDLVVPRQKLTLLTGPSGSGKSTLLRAFNRLNECFSGLSTSGSLKLWLDGRWTEVYGPEIALHTLRQRVGMVFQSPQVLPTSIEKNIALPLRLVLGLSRHDAWGAVETALTQVGLWNEVCDRLKAPATTLSGGQQTRLCLARSLALRPSILLLDEPTAMLDPRATQMIEELLLSLKRNLTLIVVSHNEEQGARLADHRLRLDRGRISH